MSSIINNYQAITGELAELCKEQKVSHEVLLLPVSKRKPASDIRTLYDVGVRHFAENYLQEAQQKAQELSDCPEINWHYVGKVQSKKCKHLAQQMAWVHTLDNIKQAMLLDEYCGQYQREAKRKGALNICVQVNLHQEDQKNGIAANEVSSFVMQVAKLSNLSLRGLMLIGQFGLNEQEQTQAFKDMHKLFSLCRKRLCTVENGEQRAQLFDTLSMGMSGDWKLAVPHGATMIRLGTTIFGARE